MNEKKKGATSQCHVYQKCAAILYTILINFGSLVIIMLGNSGYIGKS